MEPPLKLDNKNQERRLTREKESKAISSISSTKERKVALQQHVDKLKKRLRHEENVHKALERAFNRPLGSLPRLPRYLPSYTLELLAEVAVLEEEIVCLEEQVVILRGQGPSDEPLLCVSSVDTMSINNQPNEFHQSRENQFDTSTKQVDCSRPRFVSTVPSCLSAGFTNEKQPCCQGIQSRISSIKNHSIQSEKEPHQRITTSVKVNSAASRSMDQFKMKVECRLVDHDIAQQSSLLIPKETTSLQKEGNYPNKVSEDLLKCLSSIFSRMSTRKNKKLEAERFSFLTQVASVEDKRVIKFQDPYGICKEFGNRNIGPYKDMILIEANSVDTNRTTNSLFLLQRLKILLRKLASVDIGGLTHDQKLAFWINIYNSCMMNAFLEHGIPDSPQKVISLMQKAMIAVNGQSLNAMTIEHFILRLPHHTKSEAYSNNKIREQATFGLESSEPLVTFALSCGSWSSPAVRVYTACQVGDELEQAKKQYLEAAVGISSLNKLIIPKLLDWYLLDFAKDLKSLMDWICQQLPNDLGNHAIRCLERRKNEPLSQSLQVMPYDFRFRYIIHE